MLVHYSDGRVLLGILVSLNGHQVRVAVKDTEDIAEFKLLNGVWVSECCEAVTFHFLLSPLPWIEKAPGFAKPQFFVACQSTEKTDFPN
jgi:hypothetical protein